MLTLMFSVNLPYSNPSSPNANLNFFGKKKWEVTEFIYFWHISMEIYYKIFLLDYMINLL